MFAAFNTILVALDGRRGGLDAATLAGQLAHSEANLALAHVLAHATARTGDLDDRSEEATRDARRVLALTRAEASELEPPVLTARGDSVATGLRELVERHGADLLVLGAHHHRHLMLPSRDHTRAALRETSCAVAVAPWEYSMRSRAGIRSIGVGYVDDQPGRVVLDAARGLAWQLGAEVQAITVVAPSNWETAVSGLGWRAAAAGRRMDEIPGVHGTAVEGEPRHALTALSEGVDLLVIGSHHHHALRQLLLGDVAGSLSRTARCPLLVVPHQPSHN